MKSLSMFTLTFNAFSIVAGINKIPNSEEMNKLQDFNSQYCTTEEDRQAHQVPSGFKVTAAADDVIQGAWVDGAPITGMIGSNQNQGKGWQEVDLEQDVYKTKCTGRVCDHVL